MKKSIIPWLGGKSASASKLISIIPAHEGYIEAFGGAGHLLFAKEPAKWEILNDIDGDLMNFWKIVKERHRELIASFDYTLVSRELFNEYKQAYNAGQYKDDIQRAHIFYYLTRACFGARMNNPSFSTKRDRHSLRLENIERDITRAYERLLKVTIECRDYTQIIKTYDSESSFFFLDPPYRKAARYRMDRFTDEDYAALAAACGSIKGKFMLTINSDEYIKELFGGFNVTEHYVRYTVDRVSNNVIRPELIVTNYEHAALRSKSA